ncbi:MAG: CDP-alcohol phosphatidyltransferase family protein [Dehalococcoidia bacterium]|nr:CDP-alcohol phosphatidyltransferase family protein [Dehalococcoidia bacterium]MCK4579769.1 CDP-alcohol phosphatidyltransferase family protein [Dehalococcoidia bacterium]
MVDLVSIRRTAGSRIAGPIVGVLSRTGISPNAVTSLSLALSVATAGLVATGHFLLGGLLVLVSGLCDLLDGALARSTKRTTRFGAILDSTVDRASEAIVFCGLLIWYLPRGAALVPVLILVALIASFLVSYIRARAEGLGLQCQVGLFTRAERVIVLAVGLLVNQVIIALWVLVIFACVTVAQRLLYLWKQGNS